MDETIEQFSRETELALLYEIASIARHVRNLEKLCHLTLDKAVHLLGSEVALLYLADSTTGAFHIQAARGVRMNRVTPVLSLSETDTHLFQHMLVWSADQGCPIPVDPLQSRFPVKAALGIPLRNGHALPAGWLHVVRMRRACFNETELRLYEALADQSAGALEITLAWEHNRQQQEALAAANMRLEQALDETRRAYQMIRELSTPLIPIADRIVIMPLIGAIDTSRAQQVLETLLEGVARHQATLAILDITGVAVFDTQVAQALVRAAQAVRLLGAQVMLTGIQPATAQTLVHLGVDLGHIMTQASLQAGIATALRLH